MARKNNKKPVPPAQKPVEEPPKADPEPVAAQVPQLKPTTQPQPTTQSQPAPKSSAKQKSQMAPSNRARLLWSTFESWATERQDTLESDLRKLANDMDTLWRATPKQHRDSQFELNKRKAERQREKQHAFYEEMRNEWHKRLDDAGLKEEDWDDITEEEGIKVMQVLGGDVDEEPVIVTDATTAVPAPLTTGSRSTNISSDYDVVNSFNFHSDADDEPTSDAFDFTSFNDDTNSEASANPWSWESEASGYNTETPQSSSHSSPKLSADKSFLGDFVKIPGAWSQPQLDIKTSDRKKQQPRYIGPELFDPEEPPNDEADFATFKMRMRILKIREFHNEAAEADIDLARRVVASRSTSEIHDLLADHEVQMLHLQERKEIERKALVDAERQKRKKAIRERSTATIPTAQRRPVPRSNLFGESDLSDFGQQVINQLEKDNKPSRRKKIATPAKMEETSAPSQDTLRQKVSPLAEAIRNGKDYNPFEYDLNALASNIPDSMAPPIGTSFSLPAESKPSSRPISTSRTHSTSRVNGMEFWVPPAQSMQSAVKQAVPSSVKPKAATNPVIQPSRNQAPTSINPPRRPPIQHARSTPAFFPEGEWAVDADTEGASSSKTMLEDISRPDSHSFWLPSGVSKASSTTTAHHPHEIWLPSMPQETNTATPRARTLSTNGRAAEPVQAAIPVQKSQSNTKADSKRKQPDPTPSATTSSSLSGVSEGSGKRVTIEDVPDEADEEAFEHLPSDSKYILEPRPLVASTMFDQILDYEEEPAASTPKAPVGAPSWDKVMEDKAARAKHVRWTPSVVGGSPASTVVELEPKSQQKKADKKGKGKLTETGDDLSRFAMEALAGLKKFGGKAL